MADKLAISICRLSGNSGSLKLLEPSGPVQDCNGIALNMFMFIFSGSMWEDESFF